MITKLFKPVIALLTALLLLTGTLSLSAIAKEPAAILEETGTAGSAGEEGRGLLGDVNNDKALNSMDALMILKHAVKLIELTPEQALRANADLDAKNAINSSDALIVLKVAVKLIDPPEWPDPDPAPGQTPDLTKEGWQTIGENTYYVENGKLVTGLKDIGGLRYQFNDGGVLNSYVGIDVSVWNTSVDWNKVKAAGVDFVMIRVGYRGYGSAGNMVEDRMFKTHMKGAIHAGLDVGVYFYTQAITEQEAVAEANFVLERIKNYKLTYPIAFDIEKAEVENPGDVPRTEKLTNKQRTDITLAFCNTIKAANYFPIIYSNKSFLEDKLETNRLSDYHIWLAHWVQNTDYDKPYSIWQYSETGTVEGIQGNVDLDIGFFDYPAYLKENGWNHLEKES